MEPIIDQGKRSAIPSWSGYQYQGHIAIVVTLIQLMLRNDFSEYQFIISTHEDNFSDYIRYKYEKYKQSN